MNTFNLTTAWGRFKTQFDCTHCADYTCEVLAGKEVTVHPTKKRPKMTDFVAYPGLAWPYLILSPKAAAVFRKHRLPKYEEAEFFIRQGDVIHKYLAWTFQRFELDPCLIDFTQSRFFLENSKGIRRYQEIQNSADLSALQRSIEMMNSSRDSVSDREYLNAERIVYFPAATPNLDFFSPPFDLDFYIRRSFGDSLKDAGLTGYELRPRSRIYIE